MCEKAVEVKKWALKFVPDQYKSPEMCERAIDARPQTFEFVPDQYKTREMCERAVEKIYVAFGYLICLLKKSYDGFKHI